jgi:hypothetical protein
MPGVKKPQCQWCGLAFGQAEQPAYDATLPEQFRRSNPYHAVCLPRARAAPRRTMRTLVQRINAALEEPS